MNIKELAEQAGLEYLSQWNYWTAYENELERFAELVAAAERESVAKKCESPIATEFGKGIAAAIRAMGDKHD